MNTDWMEEAIANAINLHRQYLQQGKITPEQFHQYQARLERANSGEIWHPEDGLGGDRTASRAKDF